MNALFIQALLRHLLTAIGGAVVAKYGVDSVGVENVAGGVATTASLAWSVYDKYKNRQK